MVQYADDEDDAPFTLTMTLPVAVAETNEPPEDLSEEDDDEEPGETVNTSDGSVVIVPHLEDEEEDDEMMTEGDTAAGPRQGRNADA